MAGVSLDEDAIEAIVRAVKKRLATSAPAQEPAPVVDRFAPPQACGGESGHSCTSAPRPVHAVQNPAFEAMLPKLVALTSSQIAVGHSGNRFRTDLYLRVREGHADARDAVHSEVPAEWPVKNQLISLQTRCADRGEYLLYPNHGRRLSDTSRATVQAYASTRPDVQIIVGDGLSPNAIVQNGADCLRELQQSLSEAGMRTGVGFFVKFARIGVADEIATMVGARASIILVGERPGLGTGDSLSFYIAINPKLDQDNAEKNCISNVRPIGIAPREAAEQTVTILRRGFEAGVGGVALGLGWGRR
jgi:ethanolamine ammonia-lyase small subunit